MPDPPGAGSSGAMRVTLAGPSAQAGLAPCVVGRFVGAGGEAGEGGGEGEVQVDGEPATDRLRVLDSERAVLTSPAGAPHRVLLLPPMNRAGSTRGAVLREIVLDGWSVMVELEPEARAALRARARRGRSGEAPSGPTEVRAMIPGVVLAVSVAPGDTVVAGQQLVVVEAMKMQNELRAPRDGSIERIAVGPGTRIEVGDLLLVID
ncbi:MAG: biotin/lipoyl-containing protein [Chloroflexota bacterium]